MTDNAMPVIIMMAYIKKQFIRNINAYPYVKMNVQTEVLIIVIQNVLN
ncbi:MAG: hypothetical protein IJ440_05285 [Alphaproteobacteria bacterium]|nr:hypothetical protein [Alphaproteobacteria bacterium]